VSVPSSELGPPSPTSECVSPPGTKGGGTHSPAGEGEGGPNSDDRRKSLALSLLCESYINRWPDRHTTHMGGMTGSNNRTVEKMDHPAALMQKNLIRPSFEALETAEALKMRDLGWQS
jgi:hypothetical protein